MIAVFHFTWFVFLVSLLDITTGLLVPNWIVAAMAITYLTIIWLDRETITEVLGWVKTQVSKYSSPR